jgi:hypothetical protein
MASQPAPQRGATSQPRVKPCGEWVSEWERPSTKPRSPTYFSEGVVFSHSPVRDSRNSTSSRTSRSLSPSGCSSSSRIQVGSSAIIVEPDDIGQSPGASIVKVWGGDSDIAQTWRTVRSNLKEQR